MFTTDDEIVNEMIKFRTKYGKEPLVIHLSQGMKDKLTPMYIKKYGIMVVPSDLCTNDTLYGMNIKIDNSKQGFRLSF